MKKALTFLLVLVILFSNIYVVEAAAANPPSVVADGALLIDSSSSKILYEKNKDTRFYPASTTKIMTALLVLENCKLNDKVVIGKNPSSFVDGNKIYLFEGEELTVDQLLHALLIASANDAAIALAEHVAGSVEAFADMMNKKAEDLGCKNTHFVNPNGLDDPNHYTTAYDLSLIAKEAMKNDTFREIVNTVSFKMDPTNKQPLKRPLYTNNQLFLSNKYKVEGANGIKVGYTDIAGHSFVGSAYQGDTKLIVVLLHDKKPGMWEDASSLLKYGFNNYKTEKEVAKGSIMGSINVENGEPSLQLTAKEDFYYTHPVDVAPVITSNIVITNDGKSSIKKGQKMGYAEFKDKETIIGRVDLLAASDLTPAALYTFSGIKGKTIKKSVKPSIYIPICIIGLLLLLSAIRIVKVKKRKAVKYACSKKSSYNSRNLRQL